MIRTCGDPRISTVQRVWSGIRRGIASLIGGRGVGVTALDAEIGVFANGRINRKTITRNWLIHLGQIRMDRVFKYAR